MLKKLLAIFLTTFSQFALAVCGPLSSDYPIFASTFDIDFWFQPSMNGNSLGWIAPSETNNYALDNNGNFSVDSSYTVPDLDPTSFPSFTPGSDIDHNDSPVAPGTYGTFLLNNNREGTLSGGNYYIETLDLNFRSTLNLQAGNYYIGNLDADADDITINVLSEPVNIYIRDTGTIREEIQVNSGGNHDGLRFYIYNTFNINDSSDPNGDLVATFVGATGSNIQFNYNASIDFNGAILTNGTLTFGGLNYVNFTLSNLELTDLTGVDTCQSGGSTVCNFLPGDYVVHGETLQIGLSSTFNSNSLAPGNYVWNVGIDPSGNIVNNGFGNSLNIPAFDPAVFPTSSGATNLTHTDAPFSSGEYNVVSIGDGETVTFDSGDYHINSLQIAQNATVRFGQGNYYISQFAAQAQNITLIADSPDVRIYIGSSGGLLEGVQINPSAASINDMQFFIYSGVAFVVNDNNNNTDTTFNAVLVAESGSNVIIDTANSALNMNGAILSNGNVTIGFDTNITFSASDLSDLTAVSNCPIDVPPEPFPSAVAYWSLDYVNGANYPDESGNGFDAYTFGNASATTNGHICNALDIPSNTSTGEVYGLITPLEPTTHLGETGTISLWFNSNNNWSDSSTDRVLWEASTSTGYFMLVLDSSGRVDFRFTDTDGDSIGARTGSNSGFGSEWKMITLTWDIPSESIVLYIDNAQEIISTSPYSGSWTNIDTLGTYRNLAFGDARNNDSNGEVSSINGILDEIYAYDLMLTSDQVDTLFNATHPCPIEPTAYYQFEDGGWNGSANEVQDFTRNGNHLFAPNGFAEEYPAKVCNGALFNGTNAVIESSAGLFDVSNGFSVSLWINLEDLPVGTSRYVVYQKGDSSSIRITNTGLVEFRWWYDSSGNNRTITSTKTLQLNTWYHIAVTFENGDQKIYIDGVEETADNFTETMYDSNFQFSLGSNNNSEFLDGRIDEVRVYEQAINAARVLQDYTASHSCDSNKVGDYWFEETLWNGSPGEVFDNSGNNSHGTSRGATSIANGYLCRGGSVSLNTDSTTQEGIELGLDLDSQVGTDGTIAFWFQSDTDWNDGQSKTVIDASTGQTGGANDKYFYLSIRSNGALEFSLEDSSDRDFRYYESNLLVDPGLRTAGTWNHIAIVWSYTNETMEVFLNGQSALSVNDSGRTNANARNIGNLSSIGSMANFLTIRVGDNGAFYDSVVPGRSAAGNYDEVKVFNETLNASEILALMDEPHPCAGSATFHYRFNESQWVGNVDEVIDSSGYGFNGQRLGSVDTVAYGSTCRAGDFDVETVNTSINAVATGVSPNRDLGGAGTIMMWTYSNDEAWGSMPNGRNLFHASYSSAAEFYAVVRAEGKPRFILTDSAGTEFDFKTDSFYTFAEKTWAHVAFVWDLPNKEARIYVNGVLDKTQSLIGATDDLYDLPSIIIGDSNGIQGSGQLNSWQGLLEEVKGFDYALSDAEVLSEYNAFTPCVPAVSDFRISHNGSGLHCQPEPITITAHDSAGNIETTYTGTIDLTITVSSSGSSAGDWSINSGNGVLNNGTANDGTASYQFAASDQGQVILDLSYTDTNTVNINVNDPLIPASEDSSYDDNLTFSSAAVVWLDGDDNEVASGSSSIEYLTSGANHDVYIRVIDTDPTTGECVYVFENNADVEMEFSSECLNPSSCISSPSTQVQFTNNSNNHNIANLQNQVLGSEWSTHNIRFSSNSTASLADLNYTDVGSIQLKARHDLRDAEGNKTGNFVEGSVDIVSVPAQLVLTAVSAPAIAGTKSDTPAFKKAGERFNVTVEAQNSLGDTTYNFGNENTLANLSFSSSLSEPSSGNPGSISQPSGSAINGTVNDGQITYTTNDGLAWNEVGIVNISPLLTEYLGISGLTVTGTTEIGRFTPYYFSLNPGTPSFADASVSCNTTYQGQPFGMDDSVLLGLQPKDILGNDIQNYVGAFNKFSSGPKAGEYSLTNESNAGSGGLSASGINFNWADSGANPNEAELSLSGSFQFTKALVPIVEVTGDSIDSDEEFTAVIDLTLNASLLTDTDSTCYQLNSGGSCLDADITGITGANIKYGRILIENTYGPETKDLAVPIYVQIWNGNNWQVHSGDNCTSITSGQFNLINWGDGLSAGDKTIQSVTGFNNGTGTVLLRDNGSENTGRVTVQGNSLPNYLFYDYFEDVGVPSPDAPAGTATFGIYEGNGPVIYIRPNYR